MPTLTRRSKLYLENEATYRTDPDSDGSDYVLARVDGELSPPKQDMPVLDGKHWVGDERTAQHVMGSDGASLSFDMPLWGLATTARDGVTPSGEDSLDKILLSAFGAVTYIQGETVGNPIAADDWTASDFSTHGANTVALMETAAGAVIQPRINQDGTTPGPYAINYNWGTNPTAAQSIVYGIKQYSHANALEQTANSLAGIYDLDGQKYLLLGGRPSLFSMSMDAGQKARVSVGLMFDSIARSAGHASVNVDYDTTDYFTGAPPIVGESAHFEFNGTIYEGKSMSVDFQLRTVHRAAATGTNGRSQIQVLQCDPVVTFEPLYATGWEDAFRAGTTGALAMCFGNAAPGAGTFNSVWFLAHGAQVTQFEYTDDEGRIRHKIQLAVRDTGSTSDGASRAAYWLLARA